MDGREAEALARALVESGYVAIVLDRLAKQASDNAPRMAVLASKKRGSDAVEKVHRVVGAPFLKVLLTKKVCSILSPFHHRAMRLPCRWTV